MPPMVLICAELDIEEFEYLSPNDLPKNWKANPAPAGKNILLNPAHPDIKKLTVISSEPFLFDSRMFDR